MEMISSNSDKRQPTSPQNSKPEVSYNYLISYLQIIYTIANSLLQLFCHHAVAIVCCIRMPTTVLLNYSWIHFLAYVVYIFFSIGKDVKLMRVLALAGMYYINCFVLIKHEMLRIWY